MSQTRVSPAALPGSKNACLDFRTEEATWAGFAGKKEAVAAGLPGKFIFGRNQNRMGRVF
jgi:hypothetical protein